jgi:adenylate cyclase, class 2
MASRGHETEIKLAMENADAARRLLSRAGFRVSSRRAFEANMVFDTADGALRCGGKLLRLRESAGRVTITFKGPPEAGPHKSREELETEAANAGACRAIFERLGFRPMFRYEKYRAEYRQPGVGGVATVDETPIGTYVELEGNARWIDRTAKTLGFSAEQYITASYGTLYLEWCGRRGVKAGDMVFGEGGEEQRSRGSKGA